MATKRKIIYNRSLNVKTTEEQYQQMLTIKQNTGISISKLLRDNLAFLEMYHKKILK